MKLIELHIDAHQDNILNTYDDFSVVFYDTVEVPTREISTPIWCQVFPTDNFGFCYGLLTGVGKTIV